MHRLLVQILVVLIVVAMQCLRIKSSLRQKRGGEATIIGIESSKEGIY